ncbi:hypothetical protein T4D_2926 [Trichinella pseudospiralis]|uniref:Uncharacterized protein n=1 Tax=Trichinella pseudospiralis TaxID=6337 RepID=A0A0V1FI89_TRIPS|nr:hypothetical protein T4D_2926 [Trichinella pseudospiralis]
MFCAGETTFWGSIRLEGRTFFATTDETPNLLSKFAPDLTFIKREQLNIVINLYFIDKLKYLYCKRDCELMILLLLP